MALKIVNEPDRALERRSSSNGSKRINALRLVWSTQPSGARQEQDQEQEQEHEQEADGALFSWFAKTLGAELRFGRAAGHRPALREGR